MSNTAEKFSASSDKEKRVSEPSTPTDKAKLTEVDNKLREVEDPLCSPNNVQKISFQDVTTASFLIKGGVEYTPCPVQLHEFYLMRLRNHTHNSFTRNHNCLVNWV